MIEVILKNKETGEVIDTFEISKNMIKNLKHWVKKFGNYIPEEKK